MVPTSARLAAGAERELLSVVMPVYNEEATVAQVIATVLATALPVDLEVIAVNDGSGDDSARILDAIDDPQGFSGDEVSRRNAEACARHG